MTATKRKRRKPGAQKFRTAPIKDGEITGYVIRSYIDAALFRARTRRTQGLIELFEAFLDPEPRISIRVELAIERLSLGNFLDPQKKLRDIVTRAREMSWDLATRNLPGQPTPVNLHRLCPSISRGAGSIRLERIVKFGSQDATSVLFDLLKPEYDNLLAKHAESGLERDEIQRLGHLTASLNIVLPEPVEATQQFAEFTIIKNLRRTDFRSVDIAEPTEGGDTVVLKRLMPEGARIARERDGFKAGAVALSTLRDADIPRISHQLSEHAGIPYYAVEYVDGQTLAETLPLKGGTIEAKGILLKLSAALERLWSKQVLHGDLSPDNILVTPAGDVSLLDFEGAPPAKTSDLSQSFARGTTRYMSPERRANPLRLKASDDVFAFGMLAIDLVAQLRDAPVQNTIRALRADPDNANFADVLARCISDERGGRFQDVAEMSAELRRAVEGDGTFPTKRPIIAQTATGSGFVGAELQGECFSYQDLRGMDFSDAQIVDCDFSNALMSNCTLQNTRIANTTFDNAVLLSCRFQGMSLEDKVSFRQANLERTVWDGASFKNGDFSWANFWGAFLSAAHDLDAATLDRANFSRNELSDAQRAWLLAHADDVLFADDYSALIRYWKLLERPLVWWLDEISRPNGLVRLY